MQEPMVMRRLLVYEIISIAPDSLYGKTSMICKVVRIGKNN
ncbi:MAG: hypothetical protein ETSY2_26695 [Candidatus Entotheonella gemina]|uniref:Uncharacterized protein n=1 Tax=Candidatus Entotheonella gemina TaxID=1429439 RepID=W4M3R8_9BACT|nr:MAG: hypothetical protein ETSY2_26695 [Candidatus Entotheonella gemina]